MSAGKDNVQAVIAYLSSLWGVASGLSLLFPLSNVLLQAVPSTIFIEVQPKTVLTPALLTSLATILSLFSILVLISTRHDIGSRNFYSRIHGLRGLAILSFMIAVFLLLFYVALCNEYRLHYENMSTSSRDGAELYAFFGYPLVFASFTTAFTALGLREYLLEQKAARE